MQPLRIGIAGLGTVGSSVVRLLADQATLLAQRAGRPLQIVAVSARDRNRARDIDLPSSVARKLASYEKAGFGGVPICVAKTQYSFTADPTLLD